MLASRSAAYRLGLIICTVLIASCGGAQSRLASHMQRGQAYFSEGNYAKASLEFRNAMQIAPKDPEARVMAGRSAEHMGRFNVAMSLYQSVIDSNPENVGARADLARLLTLAGAAQRALDVLKPAIQQHPDDPALLTVEGAAKLGLKDEAGAQADADRALKLAPNDENAVALRAGLYGRSGDYASAAALVTAAVQKNPNSTSLREMLASLYLSAKEPEKAEEQLRALAAAKPRELSYRDRLALFYSQQNRLDDAQRVLEQTVKDFPDNDATKVDLVNFLTTQRSPAQGEQVLQGFIAKKPDDYALRLHLGTLFERAGQTKQAIAAYDEVVRRADTEPMGLVARDRIAVIALSEKRYDDAQKLVAQVLEKNPRDNEALGVRGEIELERHDTVAAIGDFRAVLRDQPRSVGVQRLLAHAYVENGEPALAEEALRAAREVAPDDSSLRIELAQLLLTARQADEAVALLEEGVRNAPSDSAIQESLVRAYLAKRDFANARTAAERLATARPELATGYYLGGLAAQGQSQLDDAQKLFEHALAVQPRSLEVLSALARLDLARKHADQAITLVKNAAERDPNAYAWNLLGELYLAQPNLALANEALTHASQLTPTWWVPHRNLALGKLAANDTAGAISEYEKGIKIAPSESGLVVELAQLYEKQGRVDDAIARYESSYQANPHDRLIANNLAMLLVTYRQDRKSLDRARDLTRQFDSATDGDLLDTDGWVHFKRAEYADALPALERAIQRTPDSQVIHYHLGMAELQVGRTDRARVDLQTALSGSATFKGADEARVALASLKSRTG